MAALLIVAALGGPGDAAGPPTPDNVGSTTQDTAATERGLLAVAREAPRAPAPHLKLADLYLRLGRLDEAIDQLHVAIGLDPANAEPFVVLSITYLHQGAYGPAEAALGEALCLDPEAPGAVELQTYLQERGGLAPR